jgi:hypothetical protein
MRVATVILSSLLLARCACAQPTSLAYDPNCYFPRVGVPTEIDTIYGSTIDGYLGSGMLNIGPAPGQPYGRIMCIVHPAPLTGPAPVSVFNTGPTFNVHDLKITQTLTLTHKIVRTGHFRSPGYTDILCFDADRSPAIIYWQDSSGNYDTARYTQLASPRHGRKGDDYSSMIPFTSQMSTDSVEDLIYSVILWDSVSQHDSLYAIYFKGGKSLYGQGQNAVADSMSPFGEIGDWHRILWNCFQGDLRGVGRNDYINVDYAGNMFFYRNDRPFSMASITQALNHDTLYAQW